MQAIHVEEVVAGKFGLRLAPKRPSQRQLPRPVAFSRLRATETTGGLIKAVPPDAAFVLLVVLAPVPTGNVRIDGRYAALSGASPGDIFIFDLKTSPVADLTAPCDSLRFYLPAAALDRRPDGQGPWISPLQIQDPVMQGDWHCRFCLYSGSRMQRRRCSWTLSRMLFTLMSSAAMGAFRQAVALLAPAGSRLGSFGVSMHSLTPILMPILRSSISLRNVGCRQAILPGLFPHQRVFRPISGWSTGESSGRRSCCWAGHMSYRRSRLPAASRTKVTSPGFSCDPKAKAQAGGAGCTATRIYQMLQ